MARPEPSEDAADRASDAVEHENTFEHIIVVMFSGHGRDQVMRDPYMRSLAEQGLWHANSCGVTHPAQPNHLAALAGELCNVSSNAGVHKLPQRNLVDLCEEAGVTWKAYMESMRHGQPPWSKRFRAKDSAPYFTASNPFSSFASIVKNQERWAKVDNEAGFFADLLNGELPQLSWIVPNAWNSGRLAMGTQKRGAEAQTQLRVSQLSQWLQGFFGRLNFPGEDSHLPEDTLVILTFDESDQELEGELQAVSESDESEPDESESDESESESDESESESDESESGSESDESESESESESDADTDSDEHGGPDDAESLEATSAASSEDELAADGVVAAHNHIYTVLLSDRLEAGVDEEGYNHYSLLASIQRNFGLDDLGKNDRGANTYRTIFGDELSWESLALGEADVYTAAAIVADEEGELRVLSAAEGESAGWFDEDPEPEIPEVGPVTCIAACSRTPKPCVAYRRAEGGVGVWLHGPEGFESLPEIDGIDAAQLGSQVAIASLPEDGVMVAWTQAQGQLMTCRFVDGAWQEIVDTGHATEDGFTLANLGKTLVLVFTRGGRMCCITQNIADCNVINTSANGDSVVDATKELWSPGAFPILSFPPVDAHASDSHGVAESGGELVAVGAIHCAVLDGVLHLLFRQAVSDPIMRTTLSLAGVLTPGRDADYGQDGTDTSVGFGTAATVRWSVPEVYSDDETSRLLAFTSTGAELVALEASEDGELWLTRGFYE